MYRKYYSYSDMPQPIMPTPKPPMPKPQKKESPLTGGILPGFEKDDLILCAILLVLLLDGCNDKLLLAALGFLFFDGIK